MLVIVRSNKDVDLFKAAGITVKVSEGGKYDVMLGTPVVDEVYMSVLLFLRELRNLVARNNFGHTDFRSRYKHYAQWKRWFERRTNVELLKGFKLALLRQEVKDPDIRDLVVFYAELGLRTESFKPMKQRLMEYMVR